MINRRISLPMRAIAICVVAALMFVSHLFSIIAEASDWSDDFEDYTIGSFPTPNWIPAANAVDSPNSYIDSNAFSGSKSLKLYGSLGSCWAALADRPLTVSPPYAVEIKINTGNESLGGCHPWRGILGSRAPGAILANPARFFLKFDNDWKIKTTSGNVLDIYSSGTWYTIKAEYEKISATRVRISYWINGMSKGYEDFDAISGEDSLTNLELTAGEGTAWFDDVKVYALKSTPTPIPSVIPASTPTIVPSPPLPTTPITTVTQTPVLTIISPKNGENISWKSSGSSVKGNIYGLNADLKTYVLVHPITTTKWWVQRAPTITGSNWETVVYLGTVDADANENYEIDAIITDKTLNEGMELGTLPDYSAIALVTVFRPAQGAPPATQAPTTEQKDSKLAPVPTAAPESSNSYLYVGIGGVVLLLVAMIALKRRNSSHVRNPLKPIALRYESQKSAAEHKEATPGLRQTIITKTEMPRVESAPHVTTLSRASGVDIKTAFGYKGATIIYKLKIENNTSDPISDIKVYPYVPDVFLLKEKEKSISLIEPKSSQTVTFDIRPTGECGECNISGRVNYYDMASRKRLDIELEPKSLSIVCPMLHGKEISEAEWHDIVSNLVKAEENTKEIDMPAETLFTMVSRIVKDMHMYMQKPEVTQNQRLFNGVARFYGEGVKGLRYATQVEVVGGEKKSKLLLKAWAEKEDALTGFYHGILDEIEKRVNVKGYIDDIIVQQYIHVGDKIGTQIKDSFIQRSTIGAGARKCPNCGREVEANEKFCMECGAKL